MMAFLKKHFIIFMLIIAAGCGSVSTKHTDDSTPSVRDSIQILDNGVRELVINAPIDIVIQNAEEILLSQEEDLAGSIILELEAKIITKFRVIDKSDLLDVAVSNNMVKRGWRKGGYTLAIHFLAIEKMQTRVHVKASIYGTFSDAPLSEEQFHLWQRMESKGLIEENFLIKLSRMSTEKYKTTWP